MRKKNFANSIGADNPTLHPLQYLQCTFCGGRSVHQCCQSCRTFIIWDCNSLLCISRTNFPVENFQGLLNTYPVVKDIVLHQIRPKKLRHQIWKHGLFANQDLCLTIMYDLLWEAWWCLSPWGWPGWRGWPRPQMRPRQWPGVMHEASHFIKDIQK